MRIASSVGFSSWSSTIWSLCHLYSCRIIIKFMSSISFSQNNKDEIEELYVPMALLSRARLSLQIRLSPSLTMVHVIVAYSSGREITLMMVVTTVTT